jgi:prepilin-type N-terminal cleavage/methylation domain-containing protein
MRVSIVRNLAMKKMRRQAVGTGERGFSLIELLIAMVVTLIVSGAVLTFLVQANQSFQTQPEMTERQQNIRAAMDLIMRDIANAGAGLPQQVQVFTPGKNNVGSPSPVGTAADPNTDELEMLTNDTGRDPLPGCATSGATVPILPMNVRVTTPASVLVLVRDLSGNTTVGGPFAVTGVATGAVPCGTVLTLSGTPPVTPAGTTPQVAFVSRVRYYIAPDAAEAVPAGLPPTPILWREVNGVAPGQQVARGIEDMQVTYRRARDIVDNPAADTCTDVPRVSNEVFALTGMCDLALKQPWVWTAAEGLDALTVEVQVVLEARGGLVVPAGQGGTAAALTQAADGTSAYRGSLRSRATPRAALILAGGDGRWQ